MSSWIPAKYKTTNWSSYNDSLRQRGSLSIWFDPAMKWVPPPSGKSGRQQHFSDAAIQTCLTLKVLFGMPLRQTTGFVQSLLQRKQCHACLSKLHGMSSSIRAAEWPLVFTFVGELGVLTLLAISALVSIVAVPFIWVWSPLSVIPDDWTHIFFFALVVPSRMITLILGVRPFSWQGGF
jgi:hypothetical protein